MNNEFVLIVSIAGSITTSVLIWRWLQDPLREMLNQRCERPGSTGFWSRYVSLMLVIAPLAMVIIFSPDNVPDATQALRRIILVILLSHFAAYAVVGRSLFKAVRERVAQEMSPARTDPARG
jgi:hypothetical protein